MKKVITYGTFDHIHQGHLNILKNAKKLGDYLIVGITSDNFDMKRGKINVDQSLCERIQNVKETGLADEIIVEEYEGQKIDDIIKYNVDIFTVGSDWVGKFDYLNNYCKVIYLERTKGISSSEIRTNSKKIRIGLIGNAPSVAKFFLESKYVNGVEISGTYDNDDDSLVESGCCRYKTLDQLVNNSDAIYVCSNAKLRFHYCKIILESNKHVLCDSPIALNEDDLNILYNISEEKNLVLMEANKTAYSTSFCRMILLAESGAIGNIVSINSTCTSLEERNYSSVEEYKTQGCMLEWAPVALLPIFKLFGTEYLDKLTVAKTQNNNETFVQMFLRYKNSCGSITIGSGVKSEGELIISGTKGYIYVPAPRWKSEVFEIRFEDVSKKRINYYRNDGEGIRYEIVAFIDAVTRNYGYHFITKKESLALAKTIGEFRQGDFKEI